MAEPRPLKTVTVQLSDRSYPIWIGSGWLSAVGSMARQICPNSRSALVVADERTAPLFGSSVRRSFEGAGFRTVVHQIPAGERSKSLAMVRQLYDALYHLDADRQTLVVALGGGVVGDVTGFAAATYARGLPFLQVPTTLLAQVDSSVGGKVAVNYEVDQLTIKNLIGAFYQPVAVFIDVATLHSLPPREFRSGLAEVIKYGVILDPGFFHYLQRQIGQILRLDPERLVHIVARSCELKAHVVTQDEKETTGYRSILNFGHTFGHAIEALTSDYTHGEAVAIGMAAAARTAELLVLFGSSERQQLVQLLQEAGLPTAFPPLPMDQLLQAMRRDKKTTGGKLTLVLPVRLGDVRLVRGVSSRAVREAIEESRQ